MTHDPARMILEADIDQYARMIEVAMATAANGFTITEARRNIARDIASAIAESVREETLEATPVGDAVFEAIMGAAKLHTHDHGLAYQITKDAMATIRALSQSPGKTDDAGKPSPQPDHSDEECPSFPGCHCLNHCTDGWKHPCPEDGAAGEGETQEDANDAS